MIVITITDTFTTVTKGMVLDQQEAKLIFASAEVALDGLGEDDCGYPQEVIDKTAEHVSFVNQFLRA